MLHKFILSAVLLAAVVSAQNPPPPDKHQITISFTLGVGVCPPGTTQHTQACYVGANVLPGNATLASAPTATPYVSVGFPATATGTVSLALPFTLPAGWFGAVTVAVFAFDVNGVLITSDPQKCIFLYPVPNPVITSGN